LLIGGVCSWCLAGAAHGDPIETLGGTRQSRPSARAMLARRPTRPAPWPTSALAAPVIRGTVV